MKHPLTRTLSNGLPAEKRDSKLKHFNRMRVRYRKGIVDRIRNVCVWILQLGQFIWDSRFLQDAEVGILASEVLPSPSGRRECKSSGPVLHRNPAASMSYQKYYCSVIIWYVQRNLPEAFSLDKTDITAGSPHSMVQEHLWRYFETQLLGYFVRYKLLQSASKSRLKAIDDPVGCILRWYHYFSLHNLCISLRKKDQDLFDSICKKIRSKCSTMIAELRDRDSQRYRDVEAPTDEMGALSHDVVLWQVKAEKSMRLFEQGRLSGQNIGHEAANLEGVGPELGIAETGGITVFGRSCLELARDLVRAREPTRKVNPGRSHILRWDSKQDIRSARPRPAPWELSCLAQHLPHNLDAVDSEKRDALLDQCKEFMISDYTFMASWDSSKPTTVGHWWNFITSAVVCGKLLAEKTAARTADSSQCQEKDATSTPAKLREVELLEKIYACCQHQTSRTIPVGSSASFDWKRHKPKMLYHSDAAARSLKDTPDVDKVKQQADAKLRKNIWQFLWCNCMPNAAETLRVIERKTGPSKLHISCFDFFLMAASNDLPEISEPVPSGRADEKF